MSFPLHIPFHVYSNCIPIKGNLRSAIYDLQRNDFDYIPNSLFEILTHYRDKTVEHVLKDILSNDDKDILLTYFEFLYDNEYIFFSTLNSKYFPKLKIALPKPYNISCLIIDILEIDTLLLNKLKIEVKNTKIECLIFRFKTVNYSILKNITEFFNDIPVRTIELYIEYNSTITDNQINDLIETNKRVSIIVKYNSPTQNVKNLTYGKIVYSDKNIMGNQNKINNIADFDVNIDLFIESKTYHNYFNKRIYINSKGDIYRFENDNLIFGNIKETEILSLLKNKKFTEFWSIKKDNIFICNKCEYRYMCVDNRRPMFLNKDNFWVLEGECNYNLSTAKWKS